MTTAFAIEAARLVQIAGLTPALIGRATGADETTVRNWINDRSSPTGARAERLAELSALVERLVRVMAPAYVGLWLLKPLAALDEDKPIDVIAAGRYRDVARLISALESPAAG